MKRGLVVSDIHSGSMYGMIPPGFLRYDGIEQLWNPAMKYLWQCWEHFCGIAEEFQPDFIIVNGDCVEGPQRKSNGFELSLASNDDQKKACIATLLYLKERTPKAKWYVTAGTGYHTGEWHEIEDQIAREIGATPYSSVGTGEYCREVLWLDCDGVLIEATHHIPTGTFAALEREIILGERSTWDDSKGMPRADLKIRSHVHRYSYAETRNQQIVTTPCWKLGDRHSRKSSPHRFTPDIGGVFIEIDPSDKKRGRAPCRITRELYKIPTAKTTIL